MRLTLREAAASLNCTEKTVLRWIAHAGLPTVRLGGLYHFNRAELMEWAIHHGIGSTALACELEPEQGPARADGCAQASALAGALRAGGVLADVAGTTLPQVLCAAVERLLPEEDGQNRQSCGLKSACAAGARPSRQPRAAKPEPTALAMRKERGNSEATAPSRKIKRLAAKSVTSASRRARRRIGAGAPQRLRPKGWTLPARGKARPGGSRHRAGRRPKGPAG